jgi:uncharacterized protein (DUF1778 family)
MKTTTERPKQERIEARVSPEQKALIERAAALEGRTLTEFVLQSSRAAAQDAIERHERLTLTTRDSAAFVEALLTPVAPNESLRAAAARHRTLIGE